MRNIPVWIIFFRIHVLPPYTKNNEIKFSWSSFIFLPRNFPCLWRFYRTSQLGVRTILYLRTLGGCFSEIFPQATNLIFKKTLSINFICSKIHQSKYFFWGIEQKYSFWLRRISLASSFFWKWRFFEMNVKKSSQNRLFVKIT